MNAINSVDSANANLLKSAQPAQIKKALLIAISILMALGMILSYSLGAPWLLIVGFFFLSLSPLFPLGKSVDDQRPRILEDLPPQKIN
jgi:hypothetical protein